MKILVLGGTRFAGRAFVEQAVDAGHAVTILHRSDTDPLPDAVRRLRGDRDPDKGDGLAEVGKLLDAGERFEAVVDMCGYVPRVVRASCEVLREHTDAYLFVSTISVYPRSADGRPSEDWRYDELEQLDDPSVEEVTGQTYGGLKVLCEKVVDEVFGERAIIPRPGIIAGPNDPTDRVTWWTRALCELDAVVVPAPAIAGLAQFIDARDVAAFFHRLIGAGTTGVFNAVGPEPGLSFHAFVNRAHAALNSRARLLEAPAAWLDANDIKASGDMPLWLAAESQSMFRVEYGKALEHGLQLRPLEETMRDIRAWDVQRGLPPLEAGMSLDRLAALASKASS